jgi:putative peptidoglycan lipid II flippase
LSATTPTVVQAGPDGPQGPPGHVARNTAIFSIATAFSRVAGLVREIVAADYFGTSKGASAFTIAFLVPNLVANLFANAALSAAFVPVFSDLLQQGKKREAFRLASTLLWIMLIALSVITAFFILLAGTIVPLFLGPALDGVNGVAVLLSQILFPVILLLGLTSLLVGVLQSYDRFTIPAIAPAVWNVVIIALVIYLRPRYAHSHHGIEAYAIAILVATGVQLLMAMFALAQIDFRLAFHIDWHDPRVRQVFVLMLPVTIGLGIVNLDALINSTMGALLPASTNGNGPRSIQDAFLLYMLPQGVFSVAVSTVLFPTLSRQAARRASKDMRTTLANGMRQIMLLLIPAAAGIMVLARPIVRLVFFRGAFGPLSLHLTSEALFWFAWSLPFAGLNLLMTRTFFALQRPWIPTKLAAINMTVDIIVSVGLYKPFGIAGLVIGTAAANMVMAFLQFRRLRIGFNGYLQEDQTLMIGLRIVVVSIFTGAIARGVWAVLNGLLGHSTPAEIVSVGAAVLAGAGFYVWAVSHMRIPEWEQISSMVSGRLRG